MPMTGNGPVELCLLSSPCSLISDQSHYYERTCFSVLLVDWLPSPALLPAGEAPVLLAVLSLGGPSSLGAAGPCSALNVECYLSVTTEQDR